MIPLSPNHRITGSFCNLFASAGGRNPFNGTHKQASHTPRLTESSKQTVKKNRVWLGISYCVHSVCIIHDNDCALYRPRLALAATEGLILSDTSHAVIKMIKQTNMPQVQRLHSNTNKYFLFVSCDEIPLV